MYLLPIGTDAPVYHFPWATIGLIAVTTLVLLASTVGLLPPVVELAADYALVHGDGPHPVQWLTSSFLHAGWWHLAGNMMFLWPFGLLVEGKIGWRRFLAVYLSIGVVESALEQLCLPGPGGTLGASSIIFGLMAIACLWAPRNDIEMAYGLWLPLIYRIDVFAFPILWLSLLMIAKEAAIAAALGLSIGSELFHLAGAALGAGVGVSFLRARLVDCEGWDLFSLWETARRARATQSHTEAKVLDGRSGEMAALPAEQADAKRTGRKLRALTRIHDLIAAGNAVGAWAEVRRTRQVIDCFSLGQRDLSRLAQSLLDTGRWEETVEAYEDLVARFPAEATVGRLLLADVLLNRQQRPAAALRHLDAIDAARLSGEEPQTYRRLRQRADELLDKGVIELEGKAWNSTSADAIPVDPSA
jgi:membrane associated rhomboid family serine protease